MKPTTIDVDLTFGMMARFVGMFLVLAVVALPVVADAMGAKNVVIHLTGWPGWVLSAVAFVLTFESVTAAGDRAADKQRKRDRAKAANAEVVRLAERIALEAREP